MTTSHTNPEPLLERGPSPRIVRVDEDRRLEAVERLVGPPGEAGRAHAEQFLAFAGSQGISLEAMWCTLDDDEAVTATVLAVPNPGRTAIVFSTAPGGAADIARGTALVAHACAELESSDLDLAQALLEPAETALRHVFRGAAFIDLAMLSYMERPLPRRLRRPPPPLPAGVTLAPYREAARHEVLRVLEASYEETLDCPGLRGLRATADILAGHRATGEFDPDLWTILRIDGLAQGVLLFNRSPASNTIELVYMGLARAVQGRGLGRLVLRHGLHALAGRSERAVTLAVDDRNEPAIVLYRGEGFRRVLRRVAMIRPLDRAAP